MKIIKKLESVKRKNTSRNFPTKPVPVFLVQFQYFLQSVLLLVTVVDYDRVGGNEPIGKHKQLPLQTSVKILTNI